MAPRRSASLPRGDARVSAALDPTDSDAATAKDASPAPEIRTTDADFRPEHPEVVDRVVLPVYFGGIILYSLLLSWCTGTAIWTGILWWAVSMSVFLGWHVQAHERIPWLPWNESCREYHIRHHWVTFPPWYYWGAPNGKKMPAGFKNGLPFNSSFAHEALLYVGALVALAGARWLCGCSWPTVLGLFIFALVFGSIGNWFHNIFHVKDHYLSKYAWFRELRALHYLHHVGSAKQNYAMVNFVLDRFVLRAYYRTAEELHAADRARAVSSAGGLRIASLKPASRTDAPSQEVPDKPTADETKEITLPTGVGQRELLSALRTSPLAHALLTGSSGLRNEENGGQRGSAFSRGWSAVFVRVLLIATGFWIFHRCNDLERMMASIAGFGSNTSVAMLDRGHTLTAGAHAYLTNNRSFLERILALSTWTTDALGFLAILMSLLGSSIRPALGLLVMLIAKTVCAALVYLPAPAGSLWTQPSLSVLGPLAPIVAYLAKLTSSMCLGGESAFHKGLLPTFINGFDDVHQHQQFFAGSVALALFFAVEIARAGRSAWRQRLAASTTSAARFNAHAMLAIAIAASAALLGGQVFVALATKAHWTIDVLAGGLVGRYALVTAAKYAPAIDRFLP
jgi:hypothetical protein